MDRLWTPWRYKYLSTAGQGEACVFCDKLKSGDDRATLIVHRAEHNFIICNLYPYNSGHIMVVPYAHVGTLEEADDDVAMELMSLTRLSQRVLREVYRPQGFNIGMNIGACAGAGVAGHIHMHLLPRWGGDANFLSTIGETRVIPEALETTYERLSAAFKSVD
jgi:ATP adenylyltransferase